LKSRPIVPMSSPDLDAADLEAVLAVMQSPILSIGPNIEAFEKEIARIAGARFAIAVSSGTAGLHIASILAGVHDGDLVVTTPFSFIASANVLLYERAVPVFVDVEEGTGLIDPDLLSGCVDALSTGGRDAMKHLPPSLRADEGMAKRPKAILPVNVFNQAADFDRIRTTARRHEIPVIEDSCETIGAAYRGIPAGSLGDIGVFAFYPNKQMTTGEGGAITTNRADWDALARSLRNQGREPGSAWLEHTRLGFNYRMDEMSAALGLAQARRIGDLLQKRQRVAAWYQERLKGMEGMGLPVVAPFTTTASWFVFVIRVLPPWKRDSIIESLAAEGIPARKYFEPIHLQPFYRERFGYAPGDFPVTERLGDQSMAVPFSGRMTEEQVDLVCHSLRIAWGKKF
jgi:perosamine synthetase